MLRTIIEAIAEHREQVRKGREVMRYLDMPRHAQCTYDKIGMKGYRREAKWTNGCCNVQVRR